MTYIGPLLSDLAAQLGVASDATILVIASDGYRFPLSASEYRRWPVLLATRQDGGSLGDKGPGRIIFPYDDHPMPDQARNMSVWGVIELQVQ